MSVQVDQTAVAAPAVEASLLVQVENLTVRLADRVAIQDVNIEVGGGELVGLVGPNGAGKTTLLRAILGLVDVTSGRVLMEGLPVRDQRWKIGYVPQRHEFAWDFPISVEDAVMTGRTRMIGWLRRPGRDDRAAVEEALSLAELTELRRRPIGELSGGQRQRVLLARALSLRPRVLLLDEPFTGIDIPTQEALGALLEDLGRRGHGMLLTTHDVHSALKTCTRLALLNRSVLAAGPPSELRDPALWLKAYGVDASDGLSEALGVRP